MKSRFPRKGFYETQKAPVRFWAPEDPKKRKKRKQALKEVDLRMYDRKSPW